mmetsp:Transcript_30064/g.57742  ORF Transcript_30064/g.57742 Transcript_30064/m.57742 type:complete len:327 (-) Transcript_30064:515-1495(-)
MLATAALPGFLTPRSHARGSWSTGRVARGCGGFFRGFAAGVLACLAAMRILQNSQIGFPLGSSAEQAVPLGLLLTESNSTYADSQHSNSHFLVEKDMERGDPAYCPEPIPAIPSRGHIPRLLNNMKARVVVELGVDSGGFSKFNLMHCEHCIKYFMVDVWGMGLQDTYADGSNLGSVERSEVRMKQALENVAAYKDVAVILRNTTLEAAAMIEDGTVDFVYVDARHDYASVMQDLEAWWPKLRRGGILAGHDYVTADEVKHWKGPCPLVQTLTSTSDYSLQPDGSRDNRAVKGAVDEFAAKHRRQVQVTYSDGSFAYFWFTWLMRK